MSKNHVPSPLAIRRGLLCLLAYLFSSVALAKEVGEMPPASTELLSEHPWYSYFQLSEMLALPGKGGGYSLAPHLAWTPTFVVSRTLAVRAEAGVSALKTSPNSRSSSNALLLQGQAFLSIALPGQYLEVGGGLQYLAGAEASMPIGTVALAFPFRALTPLERAFLSYTYSSWGEKSFHQFRLGVGLAF